MARLLADVVGESARPLVEAVVSDEACLGAFEDDLHVALDVDPKVILSLREALDEMDSDFEEPENVYHLDLFFNWAVPPLHSPPDLLVLATDLAHIVARYTPR